MSASPSPSSSAPPSPHYQYHAPLPFSYVPTSKPNSLQTNRDYRRLSKHHGVSAPPKSLSGRRLTSRYLLRCDVPQCLFTVVWLLFVYRPGSRGSELITDLTPSSSALSTRLDQSLRRTACNRLWAQSYNSDSRSTTRQPLVVYLSPLVRTTLNHTRVHPKPNQSLPHLSLAHSDVKGLALGSGQLKPAWARASSCP